VVGDQVEAWLIENGRRMSLSDGKTDRVTEALTQRAGRNFNAWGIMGFGVSWCNAVDLLGNRNRSEKDT
jgi:hypothetical protein